MYSPLFQRLSHSYLILLVKFDIITLRCRRVSPKAITQSERSPRTRSSGGLRGTTFRSVFASDLRDEMAKKLRQDGETAAEQSAGYFGDTGDLRVRYLGWEVKGGDTYVQRYSSFSRYVKSWLCMTSTLVIRRMILEKHALVTFSIHNTT